MDALIGAIVGGVLAIVGGLIGAIVGGILAIVGGYLAAWYTINQEKKTRQQDQLDDIAAAVRVVRYELAANTATLDSYLQFGGQLVHALDDEQFRRVLLTLARHLPELLRVQVVHAYKMLPSATGNIAFLGAGKSSNAGKAKAVITSVRDDLAAAGEALRLYLVNDLKVPEA
jgi:hypothetical protein